VSDQVERYEVGKGRGSGWDTMNRIEGKKESAVVVDHDAKTFEVWWKGENRGAWKIGSADPASIVQALREEDAGHR